MVRRIVRGIARTNGSSQARKSAVTLDHLRAMLLEVRGDDLKAKRDRAIVLLGFSAALRRSEIAALCVEDLRFEKRGLVVTIRRSKRTKRRRASRSRFPRRQPVALRCSGPGDMARSVGCHRRRALPLVHTEAPDARDADRRPRRRQPRQEARIKSSARGRLLRSLAARRVCHERRCAKASLDAIARTTRHKSLSVLMGYVRPAQAFDDVALTTMIA